MLQWFCYPNMKYLHFIQSTSYLSPVEKRYNIKKRPLTVGLPGEFLHHLLLELAVWFSHGGYLCPHCLGLLLHASSCSTLTHTNWTTLSVQSSLVKQMQIWASRGKQYNYTTETVNSGRGSNSIHPHQACVQCSPLWMCQDFSPPGQPLQHQGLRTE